MTAALRFGLLLPVVGKVIIRQVQVILMQRTFNFLHFAEFFSRAAAASYEHLKKFLNPSVLAVWFAMLSFKSGCSTLRGIPLKLVNLNVLRCFSKSSIDSLASLLFQVRTSYLQWVQVTCYGYKLPAMGTSLPAIGTSLPAMGTSLPAMGTSLPAMSKYYLPWL